MRLLSPQAPLFKDYSKIPCPFVGLERVQGACANIKATFEMADVNAMLEPLQGRRTRPLERWLLAISRSQATYLNDLNKCNQPLYLSEITGGNGIR